MPAAFVGKVNNNVCNVATVKGTQTVSGHSVYGEVLPADSTLGKLETKVKTGVSNNLK